MVGRGDDEIGGPEDVSVQLDTTSRKHRLQGCKRRFDVLGHRYGIRFILVADHQHDARLALDVGAADRQFLGKYDLADIREPDHGAVLL